MPFCDAYCHVGRPRFGTAADAFAVAALSDVEKLVLVLGPQVPDYGELFHAIETFGDRVRCVGIPFGDTPAQQMEIADLLIRGGVSGMRLSGAEFLQMPDVAEAFGQAGRWIYSNGIAGNDKAASGLLAWLERYPDCRIAAPHFIRPSTESLEGSLLDLLAHPRFSPIFSRHGGMGSREPYPHDDLKPWAEEVIGRAGWDRVMYGSEYPVIHWRDECLPDCVNWLETLLDVEPSQRNRFLGGNAERLIFSRPPPPSDPVGVPGWVEKQFDRERRIPLFEAGQFEISMKTFDALHPGYVQALGKDPELPFSTYVERILLDSSQ